MKRLGVFVTPEELETVKVAMQTSGMFMSGGHPVGNPEWEVYQLGKKYNMPRGTGLDPKTGEFCEP